MNARVAQVCVRTGCCALIFRASFWAKNNRARRIQGTRGGRRGVKKARVARTRPAALYVEHEFYPRAIRNSPCGSGDGETILRTYRSTNLWKWESTPLPPPPRQSESRVARASIFNTCDDPEYVFFPTVVAAWCYA